ncbi:MAG: hypothetical protein HeimC3_17370 [Candidatus Heimdallarchaeota archaeon LC_3]|nr:MAG: hypothetical protein HeimC3_17370 [Candidatus Heimdallarchaeota archaeon LC_3]
MIKISYLNDSLSATTLKIFGTTVKQIISTLLVLICKNRYKFQSSSEDELKLYILEIFQ